MSWNVKLIIHIKISTRIEKSAVVMKNNIGMSLLALGHFLPRLEANKQSVELMFSS